MDAVPLLEVEDQALGRSNPLIAPCSMLFIWLDSLNLRNWEWECKYWKLDLKQPLGSKHDHYMHFTWCENEIFAQRAQGCFGKHFSNTTRPGCWEQERI